MNTSRFSKGFTLVELVMVIVLLGVMSVGVTSFMGLGTRIYIDVSNRDELIASGRFAIERINRELREALPNSVRVTGDCLEFIPVYASGIYQDIPVAPESAVNEVKMIADGSGFAGVTPSWAVVYAVDEQHVYDAGQSRRHLVASYSIPNANGLSEWTISFSSAVQFEEDSPTERLYITASPVSYCVQGSRLFRYQDYGFNVTQTQPANNGVLMAEYIGSPPTSYFKVQPATLERNSIVTFTLVLSRNDEDILLGNEVQVANVP